MKSVSNICVISLVCIFFSGCDRLCHLPDSVNNDVGSRLSADISRMEHEIRTLELKMTLPGDHVEHLSYSILKEIGRFPEDKRKDIVIDYINMVNKISNQYPLYKGDRKWLFNFNGLLRTLDMCAIYGVSMGELVQLYDKELDFYNMSLAYLSNKYNLADDRTLRRKLELQIRNMQSDCSMYIVEMKKIYLPMVVRKRLSDENYQYWSNKMLDKANLLGAACQ